MGKPFAATPGRRGRKGPGSPWSSPYGVEEAKRARGGRESKDFAGDDEKEEVSSDEEADSEANQPNDKAAGVALRTQ
jgi:hypothetical protein